MSGDESVEIDRSGTGLVVRWVRDGAVRESWAAHVDRVAPNCVAAALAREVERLRAGDRPVPPTRERLYEVIADALGRQTGPIVSGRRVAEVRNAVWDLLSGQVPAEPEETA